MSKRVKRGGEKSHYRLLLMYSTHFRVSGNGGWWNVSPTYRLSLRYHFSLFSFPPKLTTIARTSSYHKFFLTTSHQHVCSFLMAGGLQVMARPSSIPLLSLLPLVVVALFLVSCQAFMTATPLGSRGSGSSRRIRSRGLVNAAAQKVTRGVMRDGG